MVECEVLVEISKNDIIRILDCNHSNFKYTEDDVIKILERVKRHYEEMGWRITQSIINDYVYEFSK